ncbi:hypothetical protein BDP81DRAFT_180866 [Colletotrichum phormii]|uniref:Uncharacterized protein n=1 Tax=Colletotrichum phormii TaxID=359342 RepID=A0AAJ0EK31_9PEZI|nr:uncharacterized protein BDP81DRAFT_180866 [Colletotrichum phormii]KAK1639641.1 hypothetical protein BDP81DRAFT_180866 [Colletotrichum phormii]
MHQYACCKKTLQLASTNSISDSTPTMLAVTDRRRCHRAPLTAILVLGSGGHGPWLDVLRLWEAKSPFPILSGVFQDCPSIASHEKPPLKALLARDRWNGTLR